MIEAPEPDREYLALLSYLPLKSYQKTFALMRRSRAISDQLAKTPGLIGFTFRAKIVGHRFWTLSVWEDERALQAFVGRDPHLNTMDALRSHMGDVAFIRWKVKGAEVPPTHLGGRDAPRGIAVRIASSILARLPRGRSPATCRPR